MNKIYGLLLMLFLISGCIQPIRKPVDTSVYNVAYVTGKLIGEGGRTLSDALPSLACTVKNRTQSKTERNWNPQRVMEAYYAPFVPPTKKEIEIVKNVLENDICGTEYFAYSLQDVQYLKITQVPLKKFCITDTKCILFFAKDYKK